MAVLTNSEVEENEEEVEQEEEGGNKNEEIYIPGRSQVSCGPHLAILLATKLSETGN